MQRLGWFSAAMLSLLMTTGCTHCREDLGPARLVDVNMERGDFAGRNFYEYRSHELHPDHVRRYDYHPKTYHRFKERDSWAY
ncbi:MAG: hypothetical protein M3R00_04920 [Pseudomonadota bacterium]|nr:hypothetical protein [Pseudomonadota bacterium]